VFAMINVNRLQELLRTRRIGRSIVFSDTVASTNDLAKELAALGAMDGTVVLAETQTRGRGRLCREWISPAGGLWLSTILKPKLEPSHACKLVFVAGLAVANTLRELYDLAVATKWPNDVLTNGKKMCGILAEMNTMGRRLNYVVLGIGINANFEVKVFPEALRESATTLQKELGGKVNLERLLRVLLEKLESTYDLFTSQGFPAVMDEWKSFACFLGRHVEVMNTNEEFDGLALDVDGDGSLILRLEDGSMRRVLVGDVSVRVG
jgi:BirA family biotin operon repressor/biotin-[acetyl-CoA-carboxylase] ligase